MVKLCLKRFKVFKNCSKFFKTIVKSKIKETKSWEIYKCFFFLYARVLETVIKCSLSHVLGYRIFLSSLSLFRRLNVNVVGYQWVICCKIWRMHSWIKSWARRITDFLSTRSQNVIWKSHMFFENGSHDFVFHFATYFCLVRLLVKNVKIWEF